MKKVLLLEDYLKIGEDSISEGYDQEFIEEALVVSEAEEIIDSIFEAKGDEEGGKVKKFAKGVMSFFRGDLKKIRTLGNELKDSSVKKVTAKYEVEDKRRKLDDAVAGGKLDSEKAKQKKDDLTTLQKDKEATLANKITDVKAEIDQIASDAGTGAADSAASAVKIAASLAANREILKYVEDREKKTAIVSKMKEQTTKIKDIQTELKNAAENAKTGKTQETPKTNTTSKPSEETKKDPADNLASARAELTKAQNNLRDLKGAISAKTSRITDLKAGKYDKKEIKDPESLIKKLEDEKARMESDLPDYENDVKTLVKDADEAEAKYYSSKKGKPKAEKTAKAE
jgi:chromosome segregation ATPase